ncbi:MAG: OmpA family protein [Marinilabiliaceae bacterium]|nr:OmpA family protein [Marinilabiliaceae bacterium]
MDKKLWSITKGLVLIGMITACVPLKQFEEEQERNRQLEEEASFLRGENDDLTVGNRELSAELKRLKKDVAELKEEVVGLDRLVHQKDAQYEDLLSKYNQALKQLQKGSGDGESKDLLTYLQKLQDDLQKREDDLIDSEHELTAKKKRLQATIAELQNAQRQMEAQNARLSQLEQALKQKEDAMLALRQSVSDALTGFSGDELKVHMKNGKVYVSLEEKLLFKSGSYDVNSQGAFALKKLAVILEQNEDVDILVEGHTDKVPFKSSVLIDNWDLSVKRATSVVRIILAGSHIDPVRISAAGKGEHLPVMDQETPLALQKNRRTEIILTPRLDKILNLLEAH